MFTVIAERINMTRKKIKEEAWKRNADFIASEVKKQAEAGATHIDLNAGADPSKEVEDMKWLAETAEKAAGLPFSFDSANPEALEAGLKICNRPGTIVNSVTGEKGRMETILPLVKEYNTSVICLTMDERGMPADLNRRIEVTKKLAETAQAEGIGLDRLYFDHVVNSAATSPEQGRFVLEAVSETKKMYPESHIALGLSNISFGMPGRSILNKTFLAMLIAAGCDGAIMDPCQPGLMGVLLSAEVVLGRDEFGMRYLSAYREGKI
jgi:cobalamin-dependent methionine synthase I